ncbi:MAG TPA: hypothetical protein VHE53_01250 [Patescibacteria group bacterium]|nr:hypothetical protein [Patescibacteria group bacterium]
MLEKIKNNIFSIAYSLTILITFADAYKSRTSIHTYIHISSRTIEVWAIFLLIILRIFWNQKLNGKLYKLNTYIIFPITLIVGVAFTIWDYFTPPNLVYSLTLIQYTQLVYIAAFTGIVWLLSHDNSWFKKHYEKVIFFGSISYLLTAFVISLFPNDMFAKLSQEDHLIENTQVVVLLLGVYWAVKAAKIFLKKHSTINAFIFILVAVALIFVAGDEISWGQRIFHIATPTDLAKINDQKEITVHNIDLFDRYVGVGYMVIGFYGSVMWIIQKFIKKLKNIPFTYYIPPWFCSIFFFSAFFYNFYTRTHPYHHIGVWSESTELMLYSGIMFTLLSIFLNIKNES